MCPGWPDHACAGGAAGRGGTIPSDAMGTHVEAAIAGLTDAQKAQYREQGWVVVERLFTADECDALVAHMDDVPAPRQQFS